MHVWPAHQAVRRPSCIVALPLHLSPLDVAVPKKYKEKMNDETVLCSHCVRQNRSEV
jgi:hypothetical protein